MNNYLPVLFAVLLSLAGSFASAEGWGGLPGPRPPIIDPPAFIPNPRPPIIDPPPFIGIEVEQYGQLFFVTVPYDATDAEIQEQIDLQIIEI